MIDLQHIVGVSLNGFGDAVPMKLAEEKASQYQEIEGPLQQIDSVLEFCGMVDNLLSLPLYQSQKVCFPLFIRYS